MTDAPPHSRGHLNPGDPRAVFDRFALPGLDEVVRHVWIVRWMLAPGESLAQRVLSYPAFNAVFESAPTAARAASPGVVPTALPDPLPAAPRLYPPSGQVVTRVLDGEGWAVGLLLRPCAGRVLLAGSGVRPASVPATGHPLAGTNARELVRAMGGSGHERVQHALTRWLAPYVTRLDERDRLVNEVCRLAENDASVDRAAQLADRLGVTPRTLERTLHDYLGLTPKWLIECRRLQQAATTLYADASTDLSDLAARLDYVDYAHFSRRYRTVLGETPRQTRAAGTAARAQ